MAEADIPVGRETGHSRPAALRRPLARVHRLGWGMVDQAVSSLTNFAVVLYAARMVDPEQFGAFSLAYATYGFALCASRGLASGPLQVRFSGTDVSTWRRATAMCTGTATVCGLVSGIAALIAALALRGTAESAFIALGLTLPGLLLQDSWRYAFFALGRGGQAFLSDVIWAVAMLPGLALLRWTDTHQVFWFVFVWGAAAWVAAAAGIWQARVVPRLGQTWAWVRQQGDLGVRYLAEYLFINGAGQLRTWAVGIVVGLAAVGYLQASNTLMGPFMVMYYGMVMVTVPEAVRALKRSQRHLRLFLLAASLGLAVVALAWGVVLLVALPRGLGGAVLGSLWRPTYPLMLPTIVTVIGMCFSAGASTGLHALGAARRSLRASFISSALYMVGGVAGALTGGVLGAVWGVAIATWAGLLIWGWEMRGAFPEFTTAPQQDAEMN